MNEPAAAGWVRLLVIFFVALTLAIYGLFFIMLPRLADAGMSSWWMLLGLFPYIGSLFQLLLVFIRTKHQHADELA